MLRLMPEPSRTVIAIAGFAGLRRGEIEGLEWSSYDGEALKVMRSMWQGIAREPKSKKSKASVTCLLSSSPYVSSRLTTGRGAPT